jgi:hypothetical protein
MKIDSLLDNDEKIELIIEPKKGLMLHANDLFKIIFGMFFLTIIFLIGFADFFPTLIVGVSFLFFILKAILIRLNNTSKMKYLVTNKRVIFLKNGIIKKEKKINDINKVSYENSGNNKGYIILGEVEPLFAGRGISFREDKYVLDNLTNYREVSELIKKLTSKME